MKLNSKVLLAVLSIILMTVSEGKAQTKSKKKHKTGSIYFSWGYNQESYTRSSIHVKQGALGNDYELVNVRAQDHQGWNDGITNKALTIPQYNYRLGYYFNEKQDLAIELNFDHTKYIVSGNQNVRVKGTFGNRSVDSSVLYSEQTGNYYFLNNGANFFLFNIVKRVGLYHVPSNNVRVDLTGKVGIGPVIPHVENSFFGNRNDPHFQLGGWNTGVELALRVTIMKYGYLEFSQKLDYARYSHLKIYEGEARQAFGTYESILSLGFILPTTKGNWMFHKEATAAKDK